MAVAPLTDPIFWWHDALYAEFALTECSGVRFRFTSAAQTRVEELLQGLTPADEDSVRPTLRQLVCALAPNICKVIPQGSEAACEDDDDENHPFIVTAVSQALSNTREHPEGHVSAQIRYRDSADDEPVGTIEALWFGTPEDQPT